MEETEDEGKDDATEGDDVTDDEEEDAGDDEAANSAGDVPTASAGDRLGSHMAWNWIKEGGSIKGGLKVSNPTDRSDRLVSPVKKEALFLSSWREERGGDKNGPSKVA